MEVLGKLFGSESKVRIMRLFLFNPDTPFDAESVAERARVSYAIARAELQTLRQMRLIKRKQFARRIVRRGRKKNRFARKTKTVNGFVLNPSFRYLGELQRLLLDTTLLKGDELTRKLGAAGRLKLLITSGIFIQDPESRVDVFLVGDRLRLGALEHAMRRLEAEIGKELKYAAFETAEFNYRLGMYDKLVRDILDYPHTVVLDRLGLPPMSGESR